MKNTRSIATFAAISACAALALASCSDDKKSDDNKSSSAGSSTSTSAATTSASGDSKGTSTISLDGKDWPGPFTTRCLQNGNKIALAISTSDQDTSKGAGATLEDGKLATVAVGDSTKGGIGWAEGVPGAGDAKLTRNGNTFSIEGEAFGVNITDPSAPATPKKSAFSVVFACEELVTN